MRAVKHSTRSAWSALTARRVVFSLLCSLLTPLPVHAEKYALVVGLNEYQNVRAGIVELKYAIADVEAIDTQLKAIGYKTRLLPNDRANRKTIVRELNRFAHITKPEDTFLLYYAGHGVRRTTDETTTTFWLTYEAQLDALDDEGIRLSHLLDYVRDIRARRKIVLLDHCYSGDAVDAPESARPVDVSATAPSATGAADRSRAAGAIPTQLVSRGQVSAEQLRAQIPNSAQGLLIVAAARNEAFESANVGHGYFTQALIKAFTTREASGGGPALSVSNLVDYLRTQVKALSNDKQQVAEYAMGTDLTNWMFIDRLPDPVANIAEANGKRDRFGERLTSWENQGFLSFEMRIRCEEVLDAWLKSLTPTGAPLTQVDERIRIEIEKHMTDSATAETLGRDLERQIRRILAGSST